MKLLQLLVLSLSIFCACAHPVLKAEEDDEYGGYRIPKLFLPSHYDIALNVPENVFKEGSTNFTGVVSVIFNVTEPTSNILINSQVLEITSKSISAGNKKINVTDHTFNETTKILSLTLSEELKVSTVYNLTITYVGELNATSMEGFYLSSYKSSSGATTYLATTQFETTSARQAFPSFDEPSFKATFAISLTYPTGLNLSAHANTELEKLDPQADDKTETAIFKVTPVMPTYLVAFIISDFTCSDGDDIANKITNKVCSNKETEKYRALANHYSPIIMGVLESFTGISYKDHGLGKMEQVAVPDFAAGAMENWGLVTYRLAYILYDEEESPNKNKQALITVIAHEFSHSWFGDLVTLEWWDYTFLNEGFATFFEYFAVEEITELEVKDHWELGRQFIVNVLHPLFVVEGFSTSKALTAKAASPAEISGKFDSIGYNKGGVVLRMIENFMGKDNFKKGLTQYLQAKKFSTAAPQDLLDALQAQDISAALPDKTDLATILDNWFNEPGYPLITVTSNGSDIILSQKRFLYSNDSDNTQWYVPITYTVSIASTFGNVVPSNWLIPNNSLTVQNVITSNTSWIILNNQQSAYYRVNYDETLWDRIKTVLLTNHTAIDVLNRAQIVDDLFNLARAGEVEYSDALSILEYLENESEYYPWVAASTGFTFVAESFGETSEIGAGVREMQKGLLENVLKSVTFEKVDENNQIYTIKVSEVLATACKLGVEECVVNATELFQKFKSGTKVYRNVKSVVYCNGLRYSNNSEADYNFLWDQYQKTPVATEQVLILQALGCTTDVTLLKRFLDQILDESSGIRRQDHTTAWSSVYSSNPVGLSVALEYFVDNHPDILSKCSNAPSILSNILSRINDEEQLKNATTSVEDFPDILKEAAQTALRSASANIKWRSTVSNSLTEYLNGDATTTSTYPSESSTSDETGPSETFPDPTTFTPEVTTDDSPHSVAVFSSILMFIIFGIEAVFR